LTRPAAMAPLCRLRVPDRLEGLIRGLHPQVKGKARAALDVIRALLRRVGHRQQQQVRAGLLVGLGGLLCRIDGVAMLWVGATASAIEPAELERRRTRRCPGGRLEERLVHARSGQRVAVQSLRYICWRQGSTRYELLTNVLDSRRLSAEEALSLYPRWSIERMFFDLKEVLNLKHFYAAQVVTAWSRPRPRRRGN